MSNVQKQISSGLSTVGIDAAYGKPLDLDGSTVVPVALVSYGFGSAEAGKSERTTAKASDAERGEGSGGVGFAIPVGAYVTRDGYTRFEPNTIALLTVAVPFVCVAGRALTKIIKAFKR